MSGCASCSVTATSRPRSRSTPAWRSSRGPPLRDHPPGPAGNDAGQEAPRPRLAGRSAVREHARAAGAGAPLPAPRRLAPGRSPGLAGGDRTRRRCCCWMMAPAPGCTAHPAAASGLLRPLVELAAGTGPPGSGEHAGRARHPREHPRLRCGPAGGERLRHRAGAPAEPGRGPALDGTRSRTGRGCSLSLPGWPPGPRRSATSGHACSPPMPCLPWASG